MSKLKVTPPPIIFGLGFLIGGFIHLLYAPPLPYRATLQGAGWLLTGISIVMILPVLLQFRRAKTTFDVRQQPSELLAAGLYRYSRNPTYVSLSLLYIGVALLIQSAAILIFFIPCFLLVDRFVIPNEEMNLEATFGDKYLAYKASTRRWL